MSSHLHANYFCIFSTSAFSWFRPYQYLITYRWKKKVAFCLLKKPINLPSLYGFKHLALLTTPTTSPMLPLAHCLQHYKTFLLYLSPVSHNYSLMGTRWLHRQLRLTLPITDINSFLASLDINILWIWICCPMMRTKTGWRNWEESYDPTNKMLPSSFFYFRPEELLCR